MAKTCVFYHHPCPDGMGAALAAYLKFQADAEYIGIPAGGDELPPIPEGIERIYFLDVSRPPSVLNALCEDGYKVTVIDHHKTFIENVDEMYMAGGQPQFVWHFDLSHSGAFLAWEYFHRHAPIPPLIYYLEDRDLWKWEMADSKEINAAIGSYPLTLDTYSDLLFGFDANQFYREGAAILRYKEQLIESIVSDAYKIEILEDDVPIANAPTMLASDVGHALLEKYPDAPYVGVYRDASMDLTYWSLRSEDHRKDVSEVAKLFGGGGHRNAAGFTFTGD